LGKGLLAFSKTGKMRKARFTRKIVQGERRNSSKRFAELVEGKKKAPGSPLPPGGKEDMTNLMPRRGGPHFSSENKKPSRCGSLLIYRKRRKLKRAHREKKRDGRPSLTLSGRGKNVLYGAVVGGQVTILRGNKDGSTDGKNSID